LVDSWVGEEVGACREWGSGWGREWGSEWGREWGREWGGEWGRGSNEHPAREIG
jgi:hypothetical protein